MKSVFSLKKRELRLATRLSVAVLLAYTPGLFAQDDSADSEVYELNPFVVKEEANTWNATQTLAGSRLKTDLSDVASQVEVMTIDFMDTFALNSIEEAAIYSMNAESPQENTGQGISGLGNEDVRIRGISSGTRSREFFRSGISTDNYNLTRVSISSGPNSILFGTGSASGSINSSISRASTARNFGKVGFQLDSYGGYRVSLDANKVLVEDKAALRVALLKNYRAFDEDDAFINDNRLYITGTFKPTKKTTISVHSELIDRENRRPVRSVPFDNISTYYESDSLLRRSGLVDDVNPTIPDATNFSNDPDWVANNRPFVGNQNALMDTQGNGITVIGGPQTGAAEQPRSWFGSVHSSNVSLNDQLDIYETVNRSSNGTTLLNNDYMPLDMHTTANLRANNDDAEIHNLFFNHQLAEGLFFDFGLQKERNDTFNFQALSFVEGYKIEVDNNLYLPGEGSTAVANPYLGQLYVDGGGEYSRGESSSREWRAALSYEFDVRDWTENKWLGIFGRHRMAGMYLDRADSSRSQNYDYQMMPQNINGVWQDGTFRGFPYSILDTRRAIAGLGVPGVAGDTQSGNFEIDDREINIRSYIGLPGQTHLPELPDGFSFGRPYTITDANGIQFYMDPENATMGTNGERLITGRAPGGDTSYLRTQQVSWQGYLWNDRIVATLGWREDTLNNAEEDRGAFTAMWTHPGTGEVVTASDARFYHHIDDLVYEAFDDETQATGRTTLEGIVVHPFKNWGDFSLPFGSDISFSYNKSDTFQPNTTERNPNGTFIPGEEGEGEDWGIRLSAFEGKFSLRYNEYETLAGPTKLFLPFRRWRFNWRNGGGMRDVIVMMSGGDKAIFDSYFPDPEDWPLRATDPNYDPEKAYPFGVRDGGFVTGDFDNYADPYTFTADSLAEGKEIAIAWEPNKNWSVRATYNDQQVVQSNLGTQWFQFVDEYQAIMDRTQFVEGYVPGMNGLAGYDNPAGTDLDGVDLDPNDGLAPGIDYFTWDQIPYGGNGNGRNIINGGIWGQNDDAVAGGWTRATMRERHFQEIVNKNNGTSVMKAFDGKPNDFLRNNRINLNVQYRFTEGRWKGVRVAGAYRWRAGPGIGIGTQTVNGVLVPDANVILKGKDSEFFDLSLEWRGKSNVFGLLGDQKNVSVGLTVRNLFDEGPYEIEKVDANSLAATNLLRVDGRQIILRSGLEF